MNQFVYDLRRDSNGKGHFYGHILFKQIRIRAHQAVQIQFRVDNFQAPFQITDAIFFFNIINNMPQ